MSITFKVEKPIQLTVEAKTIGQALSKVMTAMLKGGSQPAKSFPLTIKNTKNGKDVIYDVKIGEGKKKVTKGRGKDKQVILYSTKRRAAAKKGRKRKKPVTKPKTSTPTSTTTTTKKRKRTDSTKPSTSSTNTKTTPSKRAKQTAPKLALKALKPTSKGKKGKGRSRAGGGIGAVAQPAVSAQLLSKITSLEKKLADQHQRPKQNKKLERLEAQFKKQAAELKVAKQQEQRRNIVLKQFQDEDRKRELIRKREQEEQKRKAEALEQKFSDAMMENAELKTELHTLHEQTLLKRAQTAAVDADTKHEEAKQKNVNANVRPMDATPTTHQKTVTNLNATLELLTLQAKVNDAQSRLTPSNNDGDIKKTRKDTERLKAQTELLRAQRTAHVEEEKNIAVVGTDGEGNTPMTDANVGVDSATPMNVDTGPDTSTQTDQMKQAAQRVAAQTVLGKAQAAHNIASNKAQAALVLAAKKAVLEAQALERKFAIQEKQSEVELKRVNHAAATADADAKRQTELAALAYQMRHNKIVADHALSEEALKTAALVVQRTHTIKSTQLDAKTKQAQAAVVKATDQFTQATHDSKKQAAKRARPEPQPASTTPHLQRAKKLTQDAAVLDGERKFLIAARKYQTAKDGPLPTLQSPVAVETKNATENAKLMSAQAKENLARQALENSRNPTTVQGKVQFFETLNQTGEQNAQATRSTVRPKRNPSKRVFSVFRASDKKIVPLTQENRKRVRIDRSATPRTEADITALSFPEKVEQALHNGNGPIEPFEHDEQALTVLMED